MKYKEETLTMSEAHLMRKLVQEHIHALKNWIATAVEQGDNAKAKRLVTELREAQQLEPKLRTE